jgi:hypothetical protein
MTAHGLQYDAVILFQKTLEKPRHKSVDLHALAPLLLSHFPPLNLHTAASQQQLAVGPETQAGLGGITVK